MGLILGDAAVCQMTRSDEAWSAIRMLKIGMRSLEACLLVSKIDKEG